MSPKAYWNRSCRGLAKEIITDAAAKQRNVSRGVGFEFPGKVCWPRRGARAALVCEGKKALAVQTIALHTYDQVLARMKWKVDAMKRGEI